MRMSGQTIFDERMTWVDLVASGSLGAEYEFWLE